MTAIGKMITLLIMAAIILALITHPAGSAGDMAVGGSVLDNTLRTVSGAGITSGTTGTVSTGTGTSATFK